MKLLRYIIIAGLVICSVAAVSCKKDKKSSTSTKAYLSGRDFVTPDDIKAVAVNTLHHRVALTYEAKITGESIDKIIYSNVIKAKVPMV